jgi:hypothetical protein
MNFLHPEHAEVPDQLVELIGADFANQWYWEFKDGRRLLKHFALERQREIARENFRAEHRGIEGLGQNMMRIDATLYHLIGKEAGYEALMDPAFRNKLVRDNPDLCFKPTYQPKARIIVPADWHERQGPISLAAA